LTDNVRLGRRYRKHFVRGLKRLFSRQALEIGGSVAWLADPQQRATWLEGLEDTDWNVFIEGPPGQSSSTGDSSSSSPPSHMVRYLARYLTGGPISDKRIIEASQDEVVFWARPKRAKRTTKSQSSGMAQPRPCRLSGRQFMQRWCLHILPKGFTKSRWYGGYHGTKRKVYLEQCHRLLQIDQDDQTTDEPTDELDEPAAKPAKRCPHCEHELTHISHTPRPSWREVFESRIYQSQAYSPQFHIYAGRAPPG